MYSRECIAIAAETIERFTKNYGKDYDLVVIVSDRNGAASFASTVPPSEAVDIISKTISNAVLSGAITKVRDLIAKKISGH